MTNKKTVKQFAIVGNVSIKKHYRVNVVADSENDAMQQGKELFKEMFFEDFKEGDFNLGGEIQAVRVQD